jgi:hypothetical protein
MSAFHPVCDIQAAVANDRFGSWLRSKIGVFAQIAITVWAIVLSLYLAVPFLSSLTWALVLTGRRGPREVKSRRQSQIALAHRMRLGGAERRTRISPLRRSRLAWFSPPCDTLHRSLRIPYLRTGSDSPSSSWERKMPLLPKGFRPRGAADPTRTSRRKLDRYDQKTAHRCARKSPYAMSMLSNNAPPDSCPYPFMTQ